ncbi:hypothetical protein BT69DRAFT_1302094 [Atractiella rhizophila]|nr:hypothetical protein BT69DRAFT_1302094 [Atractiella rhizophila]
MYEQTVLLQWHVQSSEYQLWRASIESDQYSSFTGKGRWLKKVIEILEEIASAAQMAMIMKGKMAFPRLKPGKLSKRKPFVPPNFCVGMDVNKLMLRAYSNLPKPSCGLRRIVDALERSAPSDKIALRVKKAGEPANPDEEEEGDDVDWIPPIAGTSDKGERIISPKLPFVIDT